MWPGYLYKGLIPGDEQQVGAIRRARAGEWSGRWKSSESPCGCQKNDEAGSDTYNLNIVRGFEKLSEHSVLLFKSCLHKYKYMQIFLSLGDVYLFHCIMESFPS